MIERIDRGYAIIYVDRDGETLDMQDLMTPEMITDYYNSNGPLQWNYYLLVTREAVLSKVPPLINEQDKKNKTKEYVDAIESNDSYSRKYVIQNSDIDTFIEFNFPHLDSEKPHGKIILIKGDDWIDATRKSEEAYREEFDKLPANLRKTIIRIPSWYRNHSAFYFLREFDLLRAKLIENKEVCVIFYTHIRKEYNVAKQKFDVLLNQTDEKFYI